MKPATSETHRSSTVSARYKCLESIMLSQKGIFCNEDILKEYVTRKLIDKDTMLYNTKTALRMFISRIKKTLEQQQRIKFIKTEQGKGLIQKKMYKVVKHV